MRIFAVDVNNDLYLGANGSLALRSDGAAFAQACEHAMQSLLDEMMFTQGRGLPYFQTVWSGTPNLRAFDEAARRHLMSVPGAQAVQEFNSTVRDGVLSYQAVIRSEYGTSNIGGVKYGG